MSVAGQAQVIVGFLVHLAQLFPTEVVWGAVYKTWPAVTFGTNAVIMMLVIDVAIDTEDRQILLILALVYVVNFVAGWYADTRYRKLKLGGQAARSLRTALVSTVLQLTSKEVEVFGTGTVSQVVSDSVTVAVTKTWTAVFELWQQAMELLVMLGLSWCVCCCCAAAHPNHPPSIGPSPGTSIGPSLTGVRRPS